MKASQLKRWLKRQGCTFDNHRSGSGHVTVRRGGLVSQLPMHGGSKDLGTGLVAKIKKNLGLE